MTEKEQVKKMALDKIEPIIDKIINIIEDKTEEELILYSSSLLDRVSNLDDKEPRIEFALIELIAELE